MELGRLTTEAQNPASAEIDRLSSLEIVRLMNAEDATVADAVGREAERIAAAVDVIADRLRRGGRLIYLGAGTSGRLGVLDASECPPTFNSRPWQVVGLIAGGAPALTRAVEGAEDLPDAAVRDLQTTQLSDRDVLVGIATSGRTPYVLGGLAYANSLGAFTIGLTCNADSELTGASRLLIVPVVGPEVISGSTRMKAGTATKLVLNMLTTAAMIQLGKTYGNLMVDLQTTNQKLAARARRIVTLLTGLAPATAAAWLDRCYGDAKIAVVAHQRQLSPAAAEQLLAACGGQLRSALEGRLESDNVVREGRQPTAGPDPDTPLRSGETRTGGLLQSSPHTPCAEIGTRSVPATIPATRVSSAVPVTRGESGEASAPPTDQLVLGVDGGGSKTRVWLARAEHLDAPVIGRGEAGPGNPQAVGWATAFDNVDSAIERAFAAAGRTRGTVRAVCLALAGAGRDADQQRLEAWARRRRIAHAVCVTHDALPVLAAGTPEGVGIALIAGTGSLAFGRNAAGQAARAGGWGYLLGDEGSGYALAGAALRAVTAAWDGRAPETALAGRLLAAVGAKTSADLVRDVYQRPADRRWLASLARVVVAAADEGDAVAQQLVSQAATDLAAQGVCVARRLGFAGDHESLPVAVSGGLLIHAPRLREQVLQELRDSGLRNLTLRVVTEPLAGALRLAVQTVSAPGE